MVDILLKAKGTKDDDFDAELPLELLETAIVEMDVQARRERIEKALYWNRKPIVCDKKDAMTAYDVIRELSKPSQ